MNYKERFPLDTITSITKNIMSQRVTHYILMVSIGVTQMVGDDSRLILEYSNSGKSGESLKVCRGTWKKIDIILTAYYSPVPNQKYYSRKSKGRRNYQQELLLQGKGTHAASGKKVRIGMLAAPRKYDFGTKVIIEGLEKWGLPSDFVVEDRGGAIVKAGKRGYEYDRVDVYMGRGFEALVKAEKLGKVKTKATIKTSDCK